MPVVDRRRGVYGFRKNLLRYLTGCVISTVEQNKRFSTLERKSSNPPPSLAPFSNTPLTGVGVVMEEETKTFFFK